MLEASTSSNLETERVRTDWGLFVLVEACPDEGDRFTRCWFGLESESEDEVVGDVEQESVDG